MLVFRKNKVRPLYFYHLFFIVFVNFLIVTATIPRNENDNGHTVSWNSLEYTKVKKTSQEMQQTPSKQNHTVKLERIIKKIRDSLAKDMRSSNMFKGDRWLIDLVPEQGGRPIRNLIVSTWRSGTTFVAKVIAANPGTYPALEPLYEFGHVKARSGHLAENSVRIINNLLNCNYANLTTTLKSVIQNNPHDLRFNNHIVTPYCKTNPEVCWDPDFRTRICKLFPFHTMKLVRLSLNVTKPLLDDLDLDIRILLLVRDPRGTMQSRRHGICLRHPECRDLRLHCSDLEADFNAATKLMAEFPGRIMALRFEDISLNPYVAAKKIRKFFRLQYDSDIKDFLHRHTTVNRGDRNSVFRNSSEAPFHWREDFFNKFDQVKRIQSQCTKAMSLWGYRLAKDQDDMMEHNPVLEPPWKEMIVSKNDDRNRKDRAEL